MPGSRRVPNRYKSNFERDTAAFLGKKKIKFAYEPFSLKYILSCEYFPDFVLPNGIIVETKGKLDQGSRRKMLAVKQAHPDLDIRFVFMRASNRITKRSKTTYGAWATKYGFKWSDGLMPTSWAKEPSR